MVANEVHPQTMRWQAEREQIRETRRVTPGKKRSYTVAVASRAEAWIETRAAVEIAAYLAGRLPRGGVD